MSRPVAINADEADPVATPSRYPALLAPLMARRQKRRLGEVFGLTNFGVNLTILAPGGSSSLRHAHALQDEFIYIVSGHPTLHTDEGMTPLSPGMCAGFKAGTGNAHRLVNETGTEVRFLEMGDRTDGDAVQYPDDDLQALQEGGVWQFRHKDGTPY